MTDRPSQPPARRVRLCRLALGACTLLLLLASVLPSDPRAEEGIWAWDKRISPRTQNTLHVPAYAVLAALGVWAWWQPGRNVGRATAMFLAASAYGALLECAQAVIPGRYGSISDALLNVLGAALGAVLALAVGKRVLKKPTTEDTEITEAKD